MAIRFLVGLGNLGRKYEYSRHNIGFRVVDELSRDLPPGSWKDAGSSWIAEVQVCGEAICLVLPKTFMNRSGWAVHDLCEVRNAEAEEVLIIVDDVDLELGRLRLRRSGGPGTHNGLRSISESIGDRYPRLRFGVKGVGQWTNLADFVLADFTDDEVEPVIRSTRRAAEAVRSAVCDGLETAMNRFNRTP